MNEKWKNNLGAYLAEAGAYRIKYLKEQLSKYCEEYRKYLEEFKSVMVKTDNYGDIEDERYLVILKITISTIDTGQVTPFIIGLNFNNDGNLAIKYSTSFDFSKNTFEKQDDLSPYTFKKEIISEPEKTEKGYVLELINRRLMNYFDEIKKNN